jgi:PAS domain-containing protein
VEPYLNSSTDGENWLQILEDHFRRRGKAFLIFDRKHILKFISQYAQDILEIYGDHIDYLSFIDIFPQLPENPNFLFDKDYSFQTTHEVTYTTASGRPQDLRVTMEPDADANGYVVWVEAKSRDVTATYRKVSAYDQFIKMGWLFDQNELGYLILSLEGIIQAYNTNFKKILNLSGDWRGHNIFKFTPLHKSKIMTLIKHSLQDVNNPISKSFKFKNSRFSKSYLVQWCAYPLTDIRGMKTGIFISTRIEKVDK